MKADEVLAAAAATFRERNAVYKDNHVQVGKIMAILFPEGVSLKSSEDFDEWHLFELIVVKLTRFANSGRAHVDSIHDIVVYAAMVEGLTKETK